MSGPVPPNDLEGRNLDLLEIEVGSTLHRIYTAGYNPIYYDQGLFGRLNAPDGTYGVMYLAKKRQGAVAETFLRSPGRLLLPLDLIRLKSYCACKVTKKLTLVKLTGPGLARAGATSEVTHGSLPYDLPQQWSKAIHSLSSHFDGIAYTSRHDDHQLCYAVFDRAAGAIKEARRQKNLDCEWFYQILDTYAVGIAP